MEEVTGLEGDYTKLEKYRIEIEGECYRMLQEHSYHLLKLGSQVSVYML